MSTLSPVAAVRGRQFERIARWYLTNDPIFRTQVKNCWLWQDWPDRPGPDLGVDLVVEDFSGARWAVQAKAYSPDSRVTKGDVDTFLTASPLFDSHLIIATTNHITANAVYTLEHQPVQTHLVMRADLETSTVVWPRNVDALKPQKPSPKDPFPHNKLAVQDVVAGFDGAHRGQLIMACGTGKTLVGLWVKEKLEARRTLVLVPSLALLSQTLREWTANARSNFHFLAVCSDQSVTDDDAFISKILELPFPATTSDADIARFLKLKGDLVVFATYQSSPQIALAQKHGAPRFDLAIADEAHRCTGLQGSAFTTILDEHLIRARRRLFMTATPRFLTGRVKREAREADVEIASMDDTKQFGPVFHRLSFSDATAKGLLTDYQVVVVAIDDEEYARFFRDRRLVASAAGGVSDAESLAAALALAKAFRKFKLRRVLSFHSRIKRARQFSDSLPEVAAWLPPRSRPKGSLWATYVSGAMPSGLRNQILSNFRALPDDRPGLISNARCLAEGVDIPSLDGIAFIDPRASQVDIIQAVGRAMRLSPGKRVGTILIPILVSDSASVAETVDGSAFAPIWAVVRALRAHDDVLAEQLDEIRRSLDARRTSHRLPLKIKLDVPARVGAAFIDAVKLRLIQLSSSVWQEHYGSLCDFASENGHTRVPNELVASDGFRLSNWIREQRLLRKTGRLSSERVALLESVEGWEWEPHEASWGRTFSSLKEYARRQGTADVPVDYLTKDGISLGRWAHQQRQARRAGTLSKARQDALAGVPGWVWSKFDSKWANGLAHLDDFVKRAGSAAVPQGQVEPDGYGLGAWVSSQRASFDNDRLTPSQVALLSNMPGWSWDERADRWQQGLAYLHEYVTEYGHARVPSQWIANDGFKLGQWVAVQRSNYRSGALAMPRRRTLQRLSGWVWDAKDAAWAENFAAVRAHWKLARTGGFEKGTVIANGIDLSAWLTLQRARYGAGTLESARIKQLERLPGWRWEHAVDVRWREGYAQLREYAKEHGSALVGSAVRTSSGFRLGQWAQVQRSSHRLGKLSQERAKMLEGLVGWNWAPRESKWDTAFNELLQMLHRHGTVAVEPSSETLARWMTLQRQRRASLTPERVARLEAIPGWSWILREATWDDWLRRLDEYVAQRGNARVPQRYKCPDGASLGSWIANQREAFRRGELSPPRRAQLEARAGWEWQPSDASWESGYRVLEDFAHRKGHSHPFAKYRHDGFGLGAWVDRQRAAYAAGVLSKQRSARLEALPGWSWTGPRLIRTAVSSTVRRAK